MPHCGSSTAPFEVEILNSFINPKKEEDMKKIILALATLLLTVTASAGTSDIGSADQNSKKYE